MHRRTNEVIVFQDKIDKDMLLPIERPLRQALTIYAYRLLVILGVALVNIILFSSVMLVVRSSISMSGGMIRIPINTLVIAMLIEFVVGLIIGLSLNRVRAIYRTHWQVEKYNNESKFVNISSFSRITHSEIEMDVQKALYII